MKVKELIAKLQELDGELEVNVSDIWGWKPLDEENVEIREDFVGIK